jgi:hypothetical protein
LQQADDFRALEVVDADVHACFVFQNG